jgi:hypothetical protein
MERVSIPDVGAVLPTFTDAQIRAAARRPEFRVKRWVRRAWEDIFPFNRKERESFPRRPQFAPGFSSESLGAKITAKHTF